MLKDPSKLNLNRVCSNAGIPLENHQAETT